jgi:hypothetical protein
VSGYVDFRILLRPVHSPKIMQVSSFSGTEVKNINTRISETLAIAQAHGFVLEPIQACAPGH